MEKVKFDPLYFIVRYTLRSKTSRTQHGTNPTITRSKTLRLHTGGTLLFRTFSQAVEASTMLVNHHLTRDYKKEVYDITIVSHTKIKKGYEL